MKVATTIQISSEENLEIGSLKKTLGLSSKKAVILEGLKALRRLLEGQERRSRLQAVSRMVRQGSEKANREWAVLSTALRLK